MLSLSYKENLPCLYRSRGKISAQTQHNSLDLCSRLLCVCYMRCQLNTFVVLAFVCTAYIYFYKILFVAVFVNTVFMYYALTILLPKTVILFFLIKVLSSQHHSLVQNKCVLLILNLSCTCYLLIFYCVSLCPF